jgi:hypothetical protein
MTLGLEKIDRKKVKFMNIINTIKIEKYFKMLPLYILSTQEVLSHYITP